MKKLMENKMSIRSLMVVLLIIVPLASAVAQTALPYSENFDSYTSTSCSNGSNCISSGTEPPSAYPNHALPTGWSFPQMSPNHTTNTTASYHPNFFLTTSGSYVYSSPNSLAFKTLSSVQCVAVMPDFNRDASKLTVKFRWKCETSGTSYYLQLGIVTDPDDRTTFVPLKTYDNSTSWNYAQEDLKALLCGGTDYTAGSYRLAIRYTNTSGLGYRGFVDNVEVTETSCYAPCNLEVSNITPSSLRLSWTANAPSSATYTIFLNGTAIATTAAGATYCDLTGLPKGSYCQLGVRANCSGGGNSLTSTIITHTACDEGVSTPYAENFDIYTGYISSSSSTPTGYTAGNDVTPTCWQYLGINRTSTSTYPQAFLTSSSTYRTDGNGLLFRTKSGQGEMYAIMPKPADVNTARLYLKFSYKYTNINYAGQLTLGFMTDPSNASTFHAIEALPLENTYWHAVSYIFRYNAAFLTAMSAAGLDTATAKVYLAFKLAAGASTSVGYSCIDDVRMDVYSRCSGTLPYTEDFDSYGSTSGYYSTSYSTLPTEYPDHYMPSCWFMPNMLESRTPAYAAAYLTSASSYYVSGKGFVFNTHSYVPNVYAVVDKDFGTSANNLAFSFSYKVSNATYCNLSYGYMTNPADTTTFVALGSTTSTSWTAVADTFSNHSGVPANALLAFRFYDSRATSTTHYYGALDNVQITSVAACPDTPVTGDTTASAMASFTWHGTTYTETPATAPTHTYKTVANNCDSIVTLHLTISCDGTLPYYENFDSYTSSTCAAGANCIASSNNAPSASPNHARPTCWTYPGIGASSSTMPQSFISTSSSYVVSGKSLCLKSTARSEQAMAAVAINFGLPSSRLAFTFSGKVFSGLSLEWGVMTDPNDTTTFISFGKTTSTSFVTITDTVGNHSPLPSGTLYVAFKGYHNPSGGNTLAMVDNVIIRRWCDSTVVNHSQCTGTYTWSETGETYTESGAYRKIYENAHGGCDSVVRLNLTIGATNTATSATACDSYTWSSGNGTTYNASGNYTYSYTNFNGCTQVDTLHLTITTPSTPTNLRINNTSATSLTLTWTATDALPHAIYKDGTLLTTVAAGTNTYTVTGLTAGTRYQFGVAAKCSSSDSYSSTLVRWAWTLASTATVPYLETFDDYGTAEGYYSTTWEYPPTQFSSNHYLPIEWAFPYMATAAYDGASTPKPWVYLTNRESYNPTGSRYSLHLRGSVAEAPSVYACVAKPFNLTSDRLAFSFYWMTSNGEAANNNVAYGYMTDPNDTSTFVAFGSYTAFALQRVKDAFNLHSGVPSTAYLAFRERVKSTSRSGIIDSVRIFDCRDTVAWDSTTISACGSYKWWNTTYNAAGTYYHTFSGANQYGCDSTVRLTLTLTSATHQAFTQTACGTYTWTSGNGQTYTIGGNYTYSHTDANGCTQVDTLHLTIQTACTGTLPYLETFDQYTSGTNATWTPPSGYPSITLPDCWKFPIMSSSSSDYPQMWITSHTPCRNAGNGLIIRTQGGTDYKRNAFAVIYSDFGIDPRYLVLSFYAHNGTYSHTHYGIVTCPYDTASFVSLGSLTSGRDINSGRVWVSLAQHTADLPTGKPVYFAFRNHNFSTSSYYGYTGLDSVRIFDCRNSSIEEHVACGSYSWHGTTYTSSTSSPTYVETNMYGCDSTITLHLTINTPVHAATTATACDSYTWSSGNGSSYTTSGNYQYSHTDANGCTQVDTLHLTIN
ncbi:MAG: fibronectin type III domain-containing protein, partial [Bacteroidales bacterium]|nr:fibronectin type III domain-containing protein [Bacteroidales bacterium]